MAFEALDFIHFTTRADLFSEKNSNLSKNFKLEATNGKLKFISPCWFLPYCGYRGLFNRSRPYFNTGLWKHVMCLISVHRYEKRGWVSGNGGGDGVEGCREGGKRDNPPH